MSGSKQKIGVEGFVSTYSLAMRLRLPHLIVLNHIRRWVQDELPASMRNMVLVRPDHLLVDASLIHSVDAEFEQQAVH